MRIFFFKQKTEYEMRISDWSSDVCSSDLAQIVGPNRRRRGGWRWRSRRDRDRHWRRGGRVGGDQHRRPVVWHDHQRAGRYDRRLLLRRHFLRRRRDTESVVVGKRGSVRVELGG